MLFNIRNIHKASVFKRIFCIDISLLFHIYCKYHFSCVGVKVHACRHRYAEHLCLACLSGCSWCIAEGALKQSVSLYPLITARALSRTAVLFVPPYFPPSIHHTYILFISFLLPSVYQSLSYSSPGPPPSWDWCLCRPELNQQLSPSNTVQLPVLRHRAVIQGFWINNLITSFPSLYMYTDTVCMYPPGCKFVRFYLWTISEPNSLWMQCLCNQI